MFVFKFCKNSMKFRGFFTRRALNGVRPGFGCGRSRFWSTPQMGRDWRWYWWRTWNILDSLQKCEYFLIKILKCRLQMDTQGCLEQNSPSNMFGSGGFGATNSAASSSSTTNGNSGQSKQNNRIEHLQVFKKLISTTILYRQANKMIKYLFLSKFPFFCFHYSAECRHVELTNYRVRDFPWVYCTVL